MYEALFGMFMFGAVFTMMIIGIYKRFMRPDKKPVRFCDECNGKCK